MRTDVFSSKYRISVREVSFLSPAQFDALLNSSDAEAR